MLREGVLVACIPVASVAVSAQRSGQQPDPLAYVEARTATMQADASPTAVFDFCYVRCGT
jgi:hypothetical protein